MQQHSTCSYRGSSNQLQLDYRLQYLFCCCGVGLCRHRIRYLCVVHGGSLTVFPRRRCCSDAWVAVILAPLICIKKLLRPTAADSRVLLLIKGSRPDQGSRSFIAPARRAADHRGLLLREFKREPAARCSLADRYNNIFATINSLVKCSGYIFMPREEDPWGSSTCFVSGWSFFTGYYSLVSTCLHRFCVVVELHSLDVSPAAK